MDSIERMQIDIAKQHNLEETLSEPVERNLRDRLNRLQDNQLQQLANIHNILLTKGLPKEIIVETLYYAFTNEKVLEKPIEHCVEKEYAFLCELLESDGIVTKKYLELEKYYFLLNLGIIEINWSKHLFLFSVAEEVVETLKRIDFNKIEKKVNTSTKVNDLLSSMVNLYGVVSRVDLYNTYCQYYEDVRYNQFPDVTFFVEHKYNRFKVIHTATDYMFVDAVICNDSDSNLIIDNIINNQKNIKRKGIELVDLLKYKNSNYFESYDKLTQFYDLLCHDVNHAVLDRVIFDITVCFRKGQSGFDDILDKLYALTIDDDLKSKSQLILEDIYNNTVLWQNNGWTNNEMIIKNNLEKQGYLSIY